MASDVSPDQAEKLGWTEHGQFAAHFEALNKDGLCDPDVFRNNVSFQTIDMRDIPPRLGDFDFTWSSCAFEHLGSIEEGMRFVDEQMRCLVPGGISVHTTEYNVSSNRHTIDHETTVLYRKKDLKKLARRLRREGHKIDLEFRSGDSLDDTHVDVPPFTDVHLRTKVLNFNTTSFGLIVKKRSM